MTSCPAPVLWDTQVFFFENTSVELAIGWLLRLSQLSSVITGATRVEHVHENVKAIEVTARLTPEVLARIESILGNNPRPED